MYSQDSIISVNFDTPYIKGLSATITVQEQVGEAEWQKRAIKKTCEDLYTLQFLELYGCIVESRTPKTGAAGARKKREVISDNSKGRS